MKRERERVLDIKQEGAERGEEKRREKEKEGGAK